MFGRALLSYRAPRRLSCLRKVLASGPHEISERASV